MKYKIALFIVCLLLVSCGLVEAAKETIAEPETQKGIAKVAETGVKAFTENPGDSDWTATETAGTSVLATIVLGTLGKWLHGRMKESSPGKIIG